MIRNRELVARAKKFAGNLCADKSDRILAMVEGYETACVLSLGPDASRSKVWEGKAAERRTALCNAIGFTE